MNGGTLRSKQGCWTCRLRRKKCDEKHPFCSTCESLTITCYGYGGPKPDWMDNGEKEKAMANSIKQIVKKTSRHKGRLGISMGRFQGRSQKDNGAVKIAPKLTNASTHLSPTVRADANDGTSPSSGDNGSPGTVNGTSTDTPPSSTNESPDEVPEAFLSSLSAIKGDEAVLLMHFIDTVFPMQYPMYRPNVFEGGRGWLLSLLLRTKPLYHASLALSAYHRGALLLAASHHGCSTVSAVDQERHLAICLSDFQLAIKDVGQWVSRTCPTNSLGLMACVIQLVFFELFAGHGEAWRIHLEACINIFCKGYWDQAMELGLIDSPDRLFDGQTTLVVHEGRSPPEESAIFTFLSGVTIWLDVLSCITMGKSPRLSSFHPHAVSCNSAIKLENIIGVKNWAIFQMSRVAALHEYKIQALQQGHLSNVEFERRANEIRRGLEDALAEYSLASLEISSLPNFALSSDPPLNPEVYIITRVFTLTASIYLYLVVHGYQLETQGMASMVGEAMMILRMKMPTHLMNAIICPLYIIGSVASKEDEEFFRRAFSSAPVLDPSLEHRGKILSLLEDIWRMRETTMTGLSWQDTVRLSDRNLLLI